MIMLNKISIEKYVKLKTAVHIPVTEDRLNHNYCSLTRSDT